MTTAASLRSGDVILFRGEDTPLGHVKRIYAKRGTGKQSFKVDAEIFATKEHVVMNSDARVCLVERNRVKDRYGA